MGTHSAFVGREYRHLCGSMTKERPTQCGHEDSGLRGRAYDNALRTRDSRLVH